MMTLRIRTLRKKHLRFYSMISGKIPNINVPESHGKGLKGSAPPYMLAYDCKQQSLSLLNPLTGTEISLPPIALTWCVLLCIRSDPSGSGVSVAIFGSKVGSEHYILASCRVGDGNWVTAEQITEVIDATTGAVVHLIPPHEYVDFFVESGGDLLGISSIYGAGLRDSIPTKCCFQIHRLDEGNGNPRWVPMESIGNRFLFFHDSSGVSYDASDFPGLKGNSIYFLGSVSAMQSSKLVIVSPYLVNFDIERGTAKRLEWPAGVDSWFLPGLH
ncbi:F-box domain-containing protein [Rhynchospora pubera]|uniref:F-box domain-containing protein n=1 Tax=Rhynchospora pubera TaxID=906938 RepID=A0AAV8H4U6_9POAL|nr:F-box domain-containing protein [Rhynchospora pubera]